MNSGILPLLLLGLTLGLALSTASPKKAWRGYIIAVLVAIAVSFVPIAKEHLISVEIGLWVSTIVTAAFAYLPSRFAAAALLPAAINAGAWLGAVAAANAMRPVMLAGLFAALVFVPIHALSSRGSAIAVKVVASWMIAVGTLAVFVSMVPTPGYMQDHMQ